jgi:hypothetical protein
MLTIILAYVIAFMGSRSLPATPAQLLRPLLPDFRVTSSAMKAANEQNIAPKEQPSQADDLRMMLRFS